MKKVIKGLFFLIAILIVLIFTAIFGSNHLFYQQALNLVEEQPQGVVAKNGMVVSAHPAASKIGVDILKNGGNAYDAAIAVHFALAVVYPRAGNIGGGGFLVYRTKDGEAGSLDFREKAPGGAHRDMYLDGKGNVIQNLSIDGHLAAGVPGSVDGMFAIHGKLGSLPFKDLIQPAIDLA